MSEDLVFINISDAQGFVAAAQGTPFDVLSLLVSRACVPGFHGTVTIGETVFHQLPSPGHCMDNRHNSSLSVIEAYLL